MDKVQIIISYWISASQVLKYSSILEKYSAIFSVTELVQIDAKLIQRKNLVT